MVWDDVALSNTGFRCANIQETIDLAGVSPDDLGVKFAGDGEAEIGLADSGRADNDRDWTRHRSLWHPGERLLEGLAGIWCEEYKYNLFKRRLRGAAQHVARRVDHHARRFVDGETTHARPQRWQRYTR